MARAAGPHSFKQCDATPFWASNGPDGLCHTREGEVPTRIRCSDGCSHVANQVDASGSKRRALISLIDHFAISPTLHGSEYAGPEKSGSGCSIFRRPVVYSPLRSRRTAIRFQCLDNSLRKPPEH
jgi:hypothetical protein